MIRVTAEPDLELVRVQMSYLLTLAEVGAFEQHKQAAVRAMGLGSGRFDLLVETEGNIIQTQDVMNAFAQLVLETPVKARRIATVRAGVLTRMQSRRIAKLRSGSEVFETVADAEAWLRAGREA